VVKDIKNILSLLISVGFSSIGFIAAITVTALAAREVSDNPLFVGFPNALGVGGGVLGTQIYYFLSKKYSRYVSLSITFFVGGFGGLISLYSLIIDSFSLLLVGAFVLGIGHSATLQTRYAASFVSSKKFKATSLALAVWFSVFGSVFGPRLVSSYSNFFYNLYGSDLIVGYVIAMFGMSIAGLAITTLTSKTSLLRQAQLKDLNISNDSTRYKDGNLLSLLLVLNHFVMVVVMSATPLHVKDIGETVQLVGVIISYHTLGMFLLSPILGKLVDKYGFRNFTFIGSGILLISCSLTFFNSSPIYLKIGLYLLGLGWNFNYVALSDAISKFTIKYQTPLNIKSDSLVFVGSFIAHSTLGISYLVIGYSGLSLVGIIVSFYLFLNLKKLSRIDI
jgi:hypothetical protein